MADDGLKKLLSNKFVSSYGIPAVCILAALLVLLALARPTFTRVQSIREERAVAEAQLAALNQKLQKLNAFVDKNVQLETNFKLFDRAIPSVEGIPALLTQIQSIAQQSGSDVSALQFGGVSGGEAAAAGKGEEVRFSLSVTSSFEELQTLMEMFEVASRIIDVESLQYSLSSEEGAVSLETSLVLVSYYVPARTLMPDTPITFSLDNYEFKRNAEVLNNFTPYSSESEVVSTE